MVFLHVCHQGGPGTSQKCIIASLQEGMAVGLSVYLWIKLKKLVERTHLLVDQTCWYSSSISPGGTQPSESFCNFERNTKKFITFTQYPSPHHLLVDGRMDRWTTKRLTSGPTDWESDCQTVKRLHLHINWYWIWSFLIQVIWDWCLISRGWLKFILRILITKFAF